MIALRILWPELFESALQELLDHFLARRLKSFRR